MQPIRVKLYGLVALTRRRYVIQAACAVGMAVVLLAAWWWQWTTVREQLHGMASGDLNRLIVFGDLLPWVLLGLLARQLIEAAVVLRLFARKEAAARAAAGGQPAPVDGQRM
ncbi:MAG: hypothetical protein U0736_13930 [Gemmataceae bacterium]